MYKFVIIKFFFLRIGFVYCWIKLKFWMGWLLFKIFGLVGCLMWFILVVGFLYILVMEIRCWFFFCDWVVGVFIFFLYGVVICGVVRGFFFVLKIFCIWIFDKVIVYFLKVVLWVWGCFGFGVILNECDFVVGLCLEFFCEFDCDENIFSVWRIRLVMVLFL